MNTDINECSEGTDDCDINSDCADTDGSFTCTCREGYLGNGTFCSSKMLLPLHCIQYYGEILSTMFKPSNVLLIHIHSTITKIIFSSPFVRLCSSTLITYSTLYDYKFWQYTMKVLSQHYAGSCVR